MREAARSLPPETARAVLGATVDALSQGTQRAGGCHDPAESAAWETTRRWLRAWARGELRMKADSPENDQHAG
eukprot:6289790-Pyramimonas_sp.AAC.1